MGGGEGRKGKIKNKIMREERENTKNRNRAIIYIHERTTMTFVIVHAKIFKKKGNEHIHVYDMCLHVPFIFN